jgi:hypothetical protein
MYYRRKGQKWVPTADNLTDKQLVFKFIAEHPKSSVRTIRRGAGISNEKVTDIVAMGVKNGELTRTVVWRSQQFELTELGVKAMAMNAPPPPKWWEIPIPDEEPVTPT